MVSIRKGWTKMPLQTCDNCGRKGETTDLKLSTEEKLLVVRRFSLNSHKWYCENCNEKQPQHSKKPKRIVSDSNDEDRQWYWDTKWQRDF